MTDNIPTENATIHAGVRYTPGDGAPIEIRPGPAQVSRGPDSTMLSWTNDNDAAGSAAMPVAEFERYVQSGKITFGKP